MRRQWSASNSMVSAAVAGRDQKGGNLAPTSQSADRDVRPVRNSHRLNARAVDPFKSPDESEYFGESTYSMVCAVLEHACDRMPSAEQL